MQNKTISTSELIDKRLDLTEADRGLAQIKLLSKLMDSAIEIPGLKTRIGLDAVLGPIPGVGDIGENALSWKSLGQHNPRT